MRIIQASRRKELERLIAHDRSRDPKVEVQTARIVRDVRRRGDRALRAWSRRLDGLLGPFEVSARERQEGWDQTPRVVRLAIREAIRNVRLVSRQQLPKRFTMEVRRGVRIEQRVEPLGRVACYVPAGRHPLPSTLIMTAVPALVAGVPEIVVACPRPSPAILCAAVELGIDRVLRIGGPQAIAALAYGTESIGRVDKITGPGSAWVAAAKALVSGDVAIDFHAGPSEIVVLAASGRADWIAADLVAQAEHDADARAILVTTNRALARAVQRLALERAAPGSPARASLANNGGIVIAQTRREAIGLVNRLAPEHLVCQNARDADACHAAGTIFIGPWSAQAAGDYCTGSNHVLPTGGAARFRGGLSAADFVRVFTTQTITERGLRTIGPKAVSLAEAEGLAAHAASITTRLSGLPARQERHASRHR